MKAVFHVFKKEIFVFYERNFCFYKENSYFAHSLIFFESKSHIIILTSNRKIISCLFSHLIIVITSSLIKDSFYNLFFIKLKAILYCFIFICFSKILFCNFLNFENANKKTFIDNIMILCAIKKSIENIAIIKKVEKVFSLKIKKIDVSD